MKKKIQNPYAVALQKRTGSFAGRHSNKGLRGTGRGSGKSIRHPKHKGRAQG